jgi:hypothetical protein
LLFAFDNSWEPQKKHMANESGTISTRWWWIEASHEGKLSKHTTMSEQWQESCQV